MELAIYFFFFIIICAISLMVGWKVSHFPKAAPIFLLFNLLLIILFLNFQIYPFGILPPLFGQAKIGVLFYYHWVTWPLVASIMAFLYKVEVGYRRKFFAGSAIFIALLATLDMTQFLTEREHKHLKSQFSADYSSQSDNYSCVPTSMANLLKLHGYRVSEKEMARISLCHSGGTGGTNLAGVYYGLTQIAGEKYQVKVRGLSLLELVELGRPAMVTIVLGPLFYHSWLVVKCEKNTIYFIDPLQGDLESIQPEKFAEGWRGDAIYLVEKGAN